MEHFSIFALFLSSFLSATILPGTSEAAFVAIVLNDVGTPTSALIVATCGNTLGGITTYLVGRFIPDKRIAESKIARWCRRWGSPSLLLSWVPIVGDVFCCAAGWLKINFVLSLIFMVIGKGLRYWALMLALT